MDSFSFLEILEEGPKIPVIGDWMGYQPDFSFGDIGGKDADNIAVRSEAAYDLDLVIENVFPFAARSTYREYFASKNRSRVNILNHLHRGTVAVSQVPEELVWQLGIPF